MPILLHNVPIQRVGADLGPGWPTGLALIGAGANRLPGQTGLGLGPGPMRPIGPGRFGWGSLGLGPIE